MEDIILSRVVDRRCILTNKQGRGFNGGDMLFLRDTAIFPDRALKASDACIKPMDISDASHTLSYAASVKNGERRDVKKKWKEIQGGRESYLYRLPHNDGLALTLITCRCMENDCPGKYELGVMLYADHRRREKERERETEI